MATKSRALATPRIEQRIVLVRGERVMLDADLASLYGVQTRALNQAVKRNLARFPEDFMFRLEAHEVEELNRSQIVTGSQKHRDPRFPPHAFTEHGAIQAANVLNSARAAEMSVHVVRAFVRMREVIAQHKDIARKLDELERRVERRLADQDGAILDILRALRELTAAPSPTTKKRPIGFITPKA